MNNKKKLIIIGAGGHGRVCAEAAELAGYGDIAFLDDNNVEGLPVIGTLDDIEKFTGCCFFVAIGSNSVRKKILNKIKAAGGELVTIIHPFSCVSKSAVIGAGTVVMAGAVVQANAKIGDGVIINTCSSVDHDCTVGSFSHIAVGAHLAGTVKIGDSVFVGANCAISNNISVTSNCVIGAGTAVICDIKNAGTYVGVPARMVHGGKCLEIN